MPDDIGPVVAVLGQIVSELRLMGRSKCSSDVDFLKGIRLSGVSGETVVFDAVPKPSRRWKLAVPVEVPRTHSCRALVCHHQ